MLNRTDLMDLGKTNFDEYMYHRDAMLELFFSYLVGWK